MTSLTPEKADELIQASHESTEASVAATNALNTGRERDAIAKKRFRRTILIVGVVIALLLAGFGTVMIVLLSTTGKIKTTVDDGAATRHILTDCVQTTGKCYQDGQKNTATFIKNFLDQQGKIISLAAACAPDFVSLPLPQRVSAIQKCIADGLAPR